MELVQIYLFFFIKLQLLGTSTCTNFLTFFIFFLNISLLDPDPGGKMNADPDAQPWIKADLALHDVHGPLGYEAGPLDLLPGIAKTLHKPGITLSHLHKLNGPVSLTYETARQNCYEGN